jgi:lysophospholipase L1-like esterase
MAAVAMARGISWVDAPRAFFSGRASGDPLGCGSLMLDRVHPSVAGHTLLSDLLRVALAAPPGARVSSPD